MEFPYSYISCPCTDVSDPVDPSKEPGVAAGDDEQEKTFDPRSPRANFSLYPLEHLLYCEDCQQIRCPKCTIQEIVFWYCPSCLFEVPTSMVKSEAGRCNRNCYNCPVCTSPLAVSSINSDASLRGVQGPWILGCSYCHWSSLDIEWRFEKATGLAAQIAKLGIRDRNEKSQEGEEETVAQEKADDGPDATFARLRSFYKSQLASGNSTDPLLTPSGGLNYSSPASIARIMSIYAGRGGYGKKDASRDSPMRESANASEGLRVLDTAAEADIIRKLHTEGWNGTASRAQQAEQRHRVRFTNELRPVQTRLRTKRSRRCRACRHILVKPEPKVQSSRFKIKLVALNYIPTIYLKPLQPAPSSKSSTVSLSALPPLQASQFLLSFKNPLFDSVKLTLATPAVTPGRHAHKVTILCPDFDIGSNIDPFDEALSSSKDDPPTQTFSLSRTEYAGVGGKVAEAGKVWEKGRNWTTVVLEVVCMDVYGKRAEEDVEGDEAVLEIPVFVRMEWEADAAAVDGGSGLAALSKSDERKEKRELSYWVVLGVGQIARFGAAAPAAPASSS